jgi:uncharacterized protein (DUF58 family)
MLRSTPEKRRKSNTNSGQLQRGAYAFNRINLFATTLLGLAERRISIPAEAQVPVYPSILQMKQFEYRAFDRLSNQQGIKRLRRESATAMNLSRSKTMCAATTTAASTGKPAAGAPT